MPRIAANRATADQRNSAIRGDARPLCSIRGSVLQRGGAGSVVTWERPEGSGISFVRARVLAAAMKVLADEGNA
jgi:hypothetical protein